MKKKGYFEYEPMIYPRKLWVHIGGDFNVLASYVFGGIILPDEKYCGVTYEKAIRKSDKRYGVLVSFPSKKDMTMGNISHESSHVVDAIENAIGMEHGGEPSAYLFGWVASCINKARLGKGDFVEVSVGVEKEKLSFRKYEFEIGEIISFTLKNGHRFIGRYDGRSKTEYLLFNPCVKRKEKPDDEWILNVDEKGNVCGIVVSESAVRQSHKADENELNIYMETTKAIL